MTRPLVMTLKTGHVALARRYRGIVMGVTFSSRARAQARADALGPGWVVWQLLAGNVFYVVKEGIP